MQPKVSKRKRWRIVTWQLENDLEIVAALNKIDLPAADPDRYAAEIEKVLGIPADEILRVSAKTGEGVAELS